MVQCTAHSNPPRLIFFEHAVNQVFEHRTWLPGVWDVIRGVLVVVGTEVVPEGSAARATVVGNVELHAFQVNATSIGVPFRRPRRRPCRVHLGLFAVHEPEQFEPRWPPWWPPFTYWYAWRGHRHGWWWLALNSFKASHEKQDGACSIDVNASGVVRLPRRALCAEPLEAFRRPRSGGAHVPGQPHDRHLSHIICFSFTFAIFYDACMGEGTCELKLLLRTQYTCASMTLPHVC